MIPLPSCSTGRSAARVLALLGLGCIYLAGQPKVVFMARPGRVS